PPTTAKVGSAGLTAPSNTPVASDAIGPPPTARVGSAGGCVEATVEHPVCKRSRERRSVFMLGAGHTHEPEFGYIRRTFFRGSCSGRLDVLRKDQKHGEGKRCQRHEL